MTSRKHLLIILSIGLIAWLPTLNFWFFKAYEASWLMSVTPHTLINLIRGHSFLYFLDLKLFGWNPGGWYATAIFLHLIAGVIFYFLIKRLTKNNVIAFISGLIFIANSAYIDVLSWGSFNSYYPLLLIFMLMAVILFHKYLVNPHIATYLGVCFFIFLGFFVRETGLVIVPLLTAFDIFYTFLLSKEKPKKLLPIKQNLPILKSIFIRQLPLYGLVVVFTLIRNWYGGISGDYADRLVKWRVKLVKDGLYLELAWAMILTSGKLVTAQLIPYPLANLLRDIVSKFLPFYLVNVYFFPVVGIAIYSGLLFIAYKIRKNILFFFLILFFLAWIAAFSLFVSLAVPSDSISLSDPYSWNTMRYRYFAFVGMSAIYGILLFQFFQRVKNKFKNPNNISKLIVASLVAINVIFIWALERDIYKSAFEPSKKFYFQFNKEFPSLPKNPTFYLYPHTSGLNDYMLEWYFINGQKYYTVPYLVESQIEALITKIGNGTANLNNTYFFDYDSERGLVNKTKEARSAISGQREYSITLERQENRKVFKGTIDNGPFVEIPFDLSIIISSELSSFNSAKADSKKFRALSDYLIDRINYLNTVSIKTSITMSQRENEPFFHVLPQNLIDGNLGPRSSWIVNDRDAIITADLGERKVILAVAWGSAKNSSRVPYSYFLDISDNGKDWKRIKTVKVNKQSSVIDKFESPVTARFVRMDIRTTSGGDFAQVDEFEVIGSSAETVLNLYSSRDELLSDSLNMFEFLETPEDLNYALGQGLTHYFAKLTWETNLTDASAHDQYWNFLYPISVSGAELRVPLKEAEIFAGQGQFLNKLLTALTIDFGNVPFDVNINSVKLIPRYKLE